MATSKLQKSLIIVAILGGLGILGLLGLGLAIGFWWFTTKDQPVTELDRSLMVRAADLAPYYDDFTPSKEFETFSKERYIDFSQELSYEYDSPAENEPYIAITVSHERSASDALLVYGIEWSASRLGWKMAGDSCDFVDDNNFYQVGDQSRFAHLTADGETVGHILVARKKHSVYAFILSGYVLDQPELWHDLFDDRIDDLPKHSPKLTFTPDS